MVADPLQVHVVRESGAVADEPVEGYTVFHMRPSAGTTASQHTATRR
jgi:hypothetical protein